MIKFTKTGVKGAALLIASMVIAGCDSGGVEVGNTGNSPVVQDDTLASIDATPAFIQRGCGQNNNTEIFCPN